MNTEAQYDEILSERLDKFLDAQIKVNTVRMEIQRLAEQGKHKIKNKVIHSNLRKASIKRNEARRDLVRRLEEMAEEQE